MDGDTTKTNEGGVIEVNGRRYMPDARGALVPEEMVRPADKLIDETVRKVMGFAEALSAQIARFKGHSFDDIGALEALLAQEYGTGIGGRKGNKTLTSFDGTLKVTVQVQDHVTFGPELQVAKELVDSCIAGWSEGAGPEIRALVDHAFQVDKEGRINRAALYQLRRLDIDDARWREAMRALTDSMRVLGTATYLRFYKRAAADAPWEGVTIDLASARPAGAGA